MNKQAELKNKSKKTELVQYVRNKHRQKVGIVLAVGPGQVGWSKVHNPLDNFDKEMGLKIARGRAWKGSNVEIPTDVKRVFENMLYKSRRYWKMQEG